MTDKEKIRAEIERLCNRAERHVKLENEGLKVGDTRTYEDGLADAYDIMLNFINSLSEEPVSEKDKLRALSDGKQHLGWLDDANALEEPINKELDRFIKEHGPMATLEKCAAHFAEWGKKHSNLSVSKDFEEASKEWLKPQLDQSYANYGETKMMELTHFNGYAMLDAIEFGANWQKDKIDEILFRTVLPRFMHGGVVAMLDEEINHNEE